jgi:hypothetical protein
MPPADPLACFLFSFFPIAQSMIHLAAKTRYVLVVFVCDSMEQRQYSV